MQFVVCTGRSSLLKPIARQGQLVKPGITSSLPNIKDERVTCSGQRGTIAFMVSAVLSMFEEHIDVELMLSEKFTRTSFNAMKP